MKKVKLNILDSFSFHSHFILEVLFEPDTQIRVLSVEPDPRSSDITRVKVEVMDTEPVLGDLIERYERESMPLPQSQQSQLQTQQLPPNWEIRTDSKTGRTYYANTVTKTTQWELPTN